MRENRNVSVSAYLRLDLGLGSRIEGIGKTGNVSVSVSGPDSNVSVSFLISGVGKSGKVLVSVSVSDLSVSFT